MTRRPYQSERRASGAALTRSDILQSALELFAADGYAVSTVPRIAARAGVSVATVYSAVGGKAQLFIALFDAAAGDPAIDEAMQSVTQAAAAEDVVRAIGHGTRLVSERHQWILSEMYDNAGVDPLIADRLAAAKADLRRRFTQAAQRIRELGHHHEGPLEQVTTTLLFYFDVAAWRTLRDSDWDWDQAERWLILQAGRALGL